jgi:hypothetical protein
LKLFVVLCLAPVLLLSAHGQSIPGQNILPENPQPSYQPLTGRQRFHWFTSSTFGPVNLLVSGPLNAGWDTATTSGAGWNRFATSYGDRMARVTTSRAIEASLGAIWKEDPRYFRSPDAAFGARLKHAMASAFTAPGPDGHLRPAYARFAGNAGGNFLSILWRTDGNTSAGDAAMCTAFGVAGKIGTNALREFLPDLKHKFLRK